VKGYSLKNANYAAITVLPTPGLPLTKNLCFPQPNLSIALLILCLIYSYFGIILFAFGMIASSSLLSLPNCGDI